jgi:hypothetical protein
LIAGDAPRYCSTMAERSSKLAKRGADHRGVAILVVYLVLAVGCVDSAAPAASANVPSAREHAAPSNPAAGDSPDTPAVAASTPEQAPPAARYLALGVPAVDRPWGGRDYLRTHEVLEGLDDTELPRLGDPESAPVLERIADPGNLTLQRNRSLPLNVRFQDMGAVMFGANSINKRYLVALLKDPSFADESMHVNGFLVHAVVVQLELVDELLPTLDPGDPTYATRMSGLAQMKQGLAEFVQGALVMLTDRETVSPAARRRFSGILAAQLPTIAAQLPGATRVELRAAFTRLADSEDDPEVKANLSRAATF